MTSSHSALTSDLCKTTWASGRHDVLILLLFALALTLSPSLGSAEPPRVLRAEPLGLFDSLIPRKRINTTIMGINAFANDARFGSVRSQYREVRRTLKLRYVRILFAWNDQVQPSPDSPINFSFYDDIARSIPSGMNAVVVVTGLPSWMSNPAHWIEEDPRKTFVERWVRPVMVRFGRNARLGSYQIWNEPNMESNADNQTLGIAQNPAQYVELLAFADSVRDQVSPRRKIVSAATTAINQGWPTTPNYLREMKAAGAESFLDVWGVHFYGSGLQNMIRPGGIETLLKSLTKPIWITESGAKGVTKQREYVERYWPYLTSRVSGIKRLYYYQFTEDSQPSSTYGLRNPSRAQPVSDLYQYLRDR